MMHKLPDLPYSFDELSPVISSETLDIHYNKHHAGYINKLNDQLNGSPLAEMTLDNLILNLESGGEIYNNAAQIWNHTFYWQSMSVNPTTAWGKLADQILKQYDSLDAFKKEFIEISSSHFGSGWSWLVKNHSNEISILTTSGAANFLGTDKQALFVCDLWEHAYYLDYKNERSEYLKAFCEIIDWNFAEKNFNVTH